MAAATTSVAANPAAQAARVAALKLDTLTLLVPQQDVRTLESSIDIDPSAPAGGAVGWIEFRKERLPVYCLSAQLELLRQVPAARRVVVVLSTGQRAFGLLCSEVALLAQMGSAVQELPESMVLPGSPIYALAVHEGALACLSTATRILAAVEPSSANGASS